MESRGANPTRVSVDGRFFRVGREKYCLKGVTYGPLVPDSQGSPFATPSRTAEDFERIRQLGANTLRVYTVPPRWWLDLAGERALRVLVDVPWNRQMCFADRPSIRSEACRAVEAAARACSGHPAVLALSVANEIPPDILRWTGVPAAEAFLDHLVGLVKGVDPDRLCTFGNFPPTEYLRPRDVDFVLFNVYLRHLAAFRNYLARLQVLAETKPVVLGEFGFDSLREGEDQQAILVREQCETGFRSGLAGMFVYAYTDEWFKDGRRIADWRFGLTTAERAPKPAFHAVRQVYETAPLGLPAGRPVVSVVVACYNGARTLKACLESLERQRYPGFEVILVDDGSTDSTPDIAALFPRVRLIRHAENRGLSTARNTGIEAARGEIVAFTDADCRADEDWLHYLVNDLSGGRYAGIGGPNLLPPDDGRVAAAVMASPGGPAHVLLTDRLAEHVPGCNMAFWKWALTAIGGFDPVFRAAGDDVDVCWRLQQQGWRIGFSPGAFVWHYRRSTVRDYLRQQQGYGDAEALLERKHPEYFSPLGRSLWRGRIYAPGTVGITTRRPMIYHGLFGTGLFQSLYDPGPSTTLMAVTTLEYHVFVTLPLFVLAPMLPWLLPLAVLSLGLSLSACIAAAAQAELPRRKEQCWSRPLVALLFAVQPVVRGWARYRGRVFFRRPPLERFETMESISRLQTGAGVSEVQYWAPPELDRTDFVRRVIDRLGRLGWQQRPDTGWNRFDLEIYGGRWAKLHLTTVSEYTGDGHHTLRCRLRPALTLPARLSLASCLGAVVLIIGLAGSEHVWLWLLLLAIPALIAGLAAQERHVQRLMAVFLDSTAEELNLKKLA